jgi:formamidopyrimidine-DNA glycosylase
MPELPDVEHFKRYADSTLLNQEISEVDLQDTKLLHSTTRKKLLNTLKGQSFENTSRHGKYLGLQISNNGWVVLHFGMTGQLGYAKDPEEVPRFTRLLITFDNDYHFAFANQRRLGRIQLVDDFKNIIEEEDLGPDALRISKNDFRELLSGRRGSVKSFFMNQSNIAGMGNVYTDEALYQAGIHPSLPANKLEDEQIDGLYERMQKMLKQAIKAQANPEKMPEDWLLPNREEDGDCPRCQGKIKTAKVSGRTTYFCPKCQRKS